MCSLVYQCCGQKTLVIQGDVSVCIEGSMQPQRPRRISLRGTTCRLLSNYKSTQMLDEHTATGLYFDHEYCLKINDGLQNSPRGLLSVWTSAL
ncbi:hypothetical protein F7725_019411 [Dissostichus mawsoni]|uniref:Uncharacterized protein n=1 Tax=Dissostichus mawsoni TaxID=36200 RepID=A0A7J5YJL4_DISMA|nr:hypothetical protein F7725_019411 [Dissostichus mawsoni]